jgi:hypothetical protein
MSAPMFSRRHYLAIAGVVQLDLALGLDSPDFEQPGFRGAISGNEVMSASGSQEPPRSAHERHGEKQ